MTTAKGSLSLGGSRSDTLQTSGEQDLFTVGLTAGFNYQFVLSAASGFTSAGNLGETLIGPDNVAITGGAGTKSIHLTPATSGTYTLAVAAPSGLGNYVLSATPQDDYGTVSGQLAVGGSTTGVIESIGDTDTFTIALVAGFNYQFLLSAASDFTSVGNLGETLIGPDNVTITGGAGTKSIHLTPATSGTYTLAVAAPSGLGNYVLSATPQDDYGTVSGQLAVGGSTTGVIESIGDTDTFTIALAAGVNYQFVLSAAAGFTNTGNLGETLIGPDNVAITGGAGTKSIHLTPATSGTYKLSIAAPNGIGSYIITGTSVGLPVYRFFDNTNGTHFFTAAQSERDSIINNQSARYTEETNGYGAVATSDPNATAVYRFFDKVYGTHFFTASASERDTIQATRSDLSYESNSTFYEHSAQQGGDVAVYRFFDTQYGTHFYTGDSKEYSGLTTPGSATFRSNLTYEGIGFYAPAGSFK